jgi:hypothetical protein
MADLFAMNHGPMADGDSSSDPVRIAGRSMNDNSFLYRRTVPDFDSTVVRP